MIAAFAFGVICGAASVLILAVVFTARDIDRWS
jgi:hypothetical protein